MSVNEGQVLNILLYFVPGIIGIKVFSKITGLRMKISEHTWSAFAYSFLVTSLVKSFAPMNTKLSIYALSLLSCGISIFVAILAGIAYMSKRFNHILEGKLRRNVYNSFLQEHIDLENGSFIRAKMKNLDYYIEGAIDSFGDDLSDPWICISNYCFCNFKDEKEFYKNDHDKDVVAVNLNDLEYVEIWSGKSADDSNEHLATDNDGQNIAEK